MKEHPEEIPGVFSCPAAKDTVVPAVETVPMESAEYVLLRRINVRKAPFLTADKLKVPDAGTVVDVQEIQNDWLCLTNGTFSLCEDGKNASKRA